jgi:hypothetical protein
MTEKTVAELLGLVEEVGFKCEAGSLTNFEPWRALRDRMEADARDSLYTVEDGWAEVFSGTRFFYRSPSVDTVHLMDIAHSLGKMCRYGGHTHTFYSVAEHSCLMYRYARSRLGIEDKQTLRSILMHDATEAYLPDLPRPLKHMLPQFKAFETTLEEVIALKFAVACPAPPIVKELDTRILVDERAQAMNPSGNDWGVDGLQRLGVWLQFYPPAEATANFLSDFSEVEP